MKHVKVIRHEHDITMDEYEFNRLVDILFYALESADGSLEYDPERDIDMRGIVSSQLQLLDIEPYPNES